MRIKKEWSTAEVEDLKKNYSMTPNKKLAARCNTSVRTMVRKARELDLVKDPSFRDTIDFAGLRKGVKPWNKGKKISPLRTIPESQKATLFAKGRTAPTKDPDVIKKSLASRSETIRKDKLRRKYGMTPITKLKFKDLD